MQVQQRDVEVLKFGGFDAALTRRPGRDMATHRFEQLTHQRSVLRPVVDHQDGDGSDRKRVDHKSENGAAQRDLEPETRLSSNALFTRPS